MAVDDDFNSDDKKESNSKEDSSTSTKRRSESGTIEIFGNKVRKDDLTLGTAAFIGLLLTGVAAKTLFPEQFDNTVNTLTGAFRKKPEEKPPKQEEQQQQQQDLIHEVDIFENFPQPQQAKTAQVQYYDANTTQETQTQQVPAYSDDVLDQFFTPPKRPSQTEHRVVPKSVKRLPEIPKPYNRIKKEKTTIDYNILKS